MNYLELIGKCVVIVFIINVLLTILIYLLTPQIECTTYAKGSEGWYVKHKDNYYYTEDNKQFEPVFHAVAV